MNNQTTKHFPLSFSVHRRFPEGRHVQQRQRPLPDQVCRRNVHRVEIGATDKQEVKVYSISFDNILYDSKEITKYTLSLFARLIQLLRF